MVSTTTQEGTDETGKHSVAGIYIRSLVVMQPKRSMSIGLSMESDSPARRKTDNASVASDPESRNG